MDTLCNLAENCKDPRWPWREKCCFFSSDWEYGPRIFIPFVWRLSKDCMGSRAVWKSEFDLRSPRVSGSAFESWMGRAFFASLNRGPHRANMKMASDSVEQKMAWREALDGRVSRRFRFAKIARVRCHPEVDSFKLKAGAKLELTRIKVRA